MEATCDCDAGFSGDGCDTSDSCVGRWYETTGGATACCPKDRRLNHDGGCCPQGQELDAGGACCDGDLDACGVCGGGGVGFDRRGTPQLETLRHQACYVCNI